MQTVETMTGSRSFTYWTAVTKLKNAASKAHWENRPEFRARLDGNPIKVVSFAEMLDEVWGTLSKTVAATELGRTLQLMKASRWFNKD